MREHFPFDFDWEKLFPHQRKLRIGQNDVPDFNGENFETFGTLSEKINTLYSKESKFCKELASVQ